MPHGGKLRVQIERNPEQEVECTMTDLALYFPGEFSRICLKRLSRGNTRASVGHRAFDFLFGCVQSAPKLSTVGHASIAFNPRLTKTCRSCGRSTSQSPNARNNGLNGNLLLFGSSTYEL